MADKEKPAKAGKAEKPEGGAAGQKPEKQGKPDKAAAGKPAAKGKGDKGGKGDAQPAASPRPKDYKPRMKSHYEKVVREAKLVVDTRNATKKLGVRSNVVKL